MADMLLEYNEGSRKRGGAPGAGNTTDAPRRRTLIRSADAMTTSVPDSRPVYIYALMDPRMDEVRYIGKSVDVQRRLKAHLSPYWLSQSTHKSNWLRGLLAAGHQPIVHILDTATERSWEAAERRLIAQYRAAGCRLTNMTEGGDGATGRVHSAETRAKIAKSHTGMHTSPETRATISAVKRGKPVLAQRGKVVKPETRAKISATLTGRSNPISAETRAKMVASRKGKPSSLRGYKHTPEARARMSAAQKERVHRASEIDRFKEMQRRNAMRGTSQETRAKLSASIKGKKRSAETRAKMSAARMGRPMSLETRAKLSETRRRMAVERKRDGVRDG